MRAPRVIIVLAVSAALWPPFHTVPAPAPAPAPRPSYTYRHTVPSVTLPALPAPQQTFKPAR